VQLVIQDVDSFLLAAGYRYLSCTLVTDGLYSVKDSEWNYSDVPHLNYVHARVEGCPLLTSKNHVSSLFMQRLGPFVVPASLHVSHLEARVHDYLLTILNIVVRVATSHERSDSGCLTITQYTFYFRGFLGRLAALMARFATKCNYGVLMSEDLPMRVQRHRLRQLGVVFDFDHSPLIGFSDTLNICENHLDASGLCLPLGLTHVALICDDGDLMVEELLLRIRWDRDSVMILPLVCPHEGAPLDSCNLHSGNVLMCPWHGRRLLPLEVLSRAHMETEFSFDFCRLHYLAKLISPRSDHQFLQLAVRAKRPEP